MNLYVDGILQASTTGPTGSKTAPATLRIGSLQTGLNFFNGQMDDVQLYAEVLTPEQIAALANPGPSQTPTNLTYATSGNTLTLSWPSSHLGWTLQAQTNSLHTGLDTTWFSLPGSTSTNQVQIPVNPANPAVFYRLSFP
jgi:hypothetical protein